MTLLILPKAPLSIIIKICLARSGTEMALLFIRKVPSLLKYRHNRLVSQVSSTKPAAITKREKEPILALVQKGRKRHLLKKSSPLDMYRHFFRDALRERRVRKRFVCCGENLPFSSCFLGIPNCTSHLRHLCTKQFHEDVAWSVILSSILLRARLGCLTKPSDISHLTKFSWPILQETDIFTK